MAEDIRINLTFCDHPKTIKLVRALGPGAPMHLIRLWSVAAMEFSDGSLRGKDIDDIEIMCRWDGEPGKLVAVLLDHEWLDLKRGTFHLHNWKQRQPWLMGKKDRSLTASLKAQNMWKKRLQKELTENKDQSDVQPSYSYHAPSPSPKPNHKTKTKTISKLTTPYSDEFDLHVWDPWRSHGAHKIGAGPGVKKKAWVAYQTKATTPTQVDQIIQAIPIYLDDADAMGIMTQHLSTWINQEAYVDWCARQPRENKKQPKQSLSRRLFEASKQMESDQ